MLARAFPCRKRPLTSLSGKFSVTALTGCPLSTSSLSFRGRTSLNERERGGELREVTRDFPTTTRYLFRREGNGREGGERTRWFRWILLPPGRIPLTAVTRTSSAEFSDYTLPGRVGIRLFSPPLLSLPPGRSPRATLWRTSGYIMASMVAQKPRFSAPESPYRLSSFCSREYGIDQRLRERTFFRNG